MHSIGNRTNPGKHEIMFCFSGQTLTLTDQANTKQNLAYGAIATAKRMYSHFFETYTQLISTSFNGTSVAVDSTECRKFAAPCQAIPQVSRMSTTSGPSGPAKPPKTTECTAPKRAHANMAKTASHTIHTIRTGARINKSHLHNCFQQLPIIPISSNPVDIC